MMPSFFCPTEIHPGNGALQKLPELMQRLQSKSVLLVIDAAVLKTPFGQQAQTLLGQSGVSVQTYDHVEPDPGDDLVLAGFEIAHSHHVDTIVAIGGGSAIDIAKAIGILVTNGGKIQDYEGIDRYTQAPLPLIAVPTTAGTGSEVSGSCVITDKASGRKMSIRHARMNPARHAILDPQGLATVPAHVAAHAGIDAFVHALESYTSRQSNAITDALNLQAIEMISASLPLYVHDRHNANAALQTLVGSTLAGMTFGQTGLGNVHCMARFVGAKYGLSHGLSNALCLPVVARFNAAAVAPRYARVAQAMRVCTPDTPEEQGVTQALQAIERLCLEVGIPEGLRAVGANTDDFAQIAKDCLEAGYNRWNPRTTTEADFLALLHDAY